MDPKRMISTRTWADPWFEELSSEEKLLWLYLLTNQQTNLIGIYEISIKRISNESGINLTGCQTHLDGFANSSKIIWNGSYMVICNFLKHQSLANPNMEKAAHKIFKSLPESMIKLLQSHGINDFKQFLNGFANPLVTHANGFGERERESEREIERESERELPKGKQIPLQPIGFAEILDDEFFEGHRNMKVDSIPVQKPEEKKGEVAPTTNPIIIIETEEFDGEVLQAEQWPTFQDFWDDYDKKRGDREKIEQKWKKLKQSEKLDIMAYLPIYKDSTPDKSFRKDPATFLNNKSWNDEIITRKPTQQLIQSITGKHADFDRLRAKLHGSKTD